MIHLLLHFLVPLAVARGLYGKLWFKTYLVLCATMLVDLDHLLADPIYDPQRCSINYHPLHSQWMIGIYVILLAPRKLRVIGLGLLIHMGLDWQDCTYPFSF